jgi:hypothetical protein
MPQFSNKLHHILYWITYTLSPQGINITYYKVEAKPPTMRSLLSYNLLSWWTLSYLNSGFYQRSKRGPWSYGGWIYSYLCNQCLSPLVLWVRISRYTTLCDKVCQWFFPRYSWHIVERAVKHHQTNKQQKRSKRDFGLLTRVVLFMSNYQIFCLLISMSRDI